MYRIVAINPDGSETTIYDPAGAGALPVLGPRTTEELNEPGSLEFALVFGHTAFDGLAPKKTYVKAELDGREIFYGRVLNAEPSPLTGQIQYMCAGAQSFLQDSEVPPDAKKTDGSSDFQTMTAEAFFRRCIAAHNADIGNDPRRTFTVGVVSHSRKNEEREYQLSAYNNTKSVIDQELISYYGGFLRTRRENGQLMIDWVEQYGDTDQGTLELGRNIISLLNRMTGEDLYTTIRPVGKDGLTLSGGGTVDVFPSAEMAEYGKIVRNVQFPDATTEQDLRSKAEALVNKIQKTMLISSEISLVDMIFTDEDSHGVNLGDVYTNIAGLEGTPMTVGARNRDFENPQNDSCTLKNPKAFEGDANGESKNSGSSISKRSSRNSASAGYAYKYIHEFQDRLELNTKEIYINAEQLELHADKFIETANEFARISHKQGEMEDELNVIEGTGVFQNSEHITQLAGRFYYDPVTGAVELLDGSEFKIHDRDGAMITVGTRLGELTDKTATFEGSALWTQRNNITGVVGEFDVITVDGRRTLVVKSGGGIKIRRDNVEFGLYDEGNLTGGILSKKLNDGTVVTKIRGDVIDLTTNDSFTHLSLNQNGLAIRVGNNETGIALLTNTVDGLRSTVTGQGGQIATLENTAQGLTSTVTDHTRQISTLQNTVNGLESTVDDQQGNISSLINTVDGLDHRVQDNSGNISTLTNTARGLQSTVTDNTNQISTLANTVNGLESTVDDHQDNISTLTNTVSGMQSHVTDAEHNISVLENTARGLSSTVTDQSNQISTLTNTVNGLSSTVTGQGGQISTLSNTLDGFSTRVSKVVDENGTIKTASIVTAVNNSGSSILLDAEKIRITGNTTIKDCFMVDGYGIHALRNFYGTNAEFSGGITTGGVSFTGYGNTTYYMPASTVATMIKTAAKNGNTLTLTRFDGTTLDFSSATSLSGAWSGSTYTVTASPQGRKHSVAIVSRLYGTAQYSNFSAEFGTSDGSGNFIKHGESRGYLIENASGRYVDVSTAASGGSTVARISTAATYNAGYNAGNSAGYSSGYNAGYNNAKPVSGTAGGRTAGVSSLVHDFTIKKGDGGTVTLAIDVSGIYSTARSGYYTSDQYNSYGTTRYNAGVTAGKNAVTINKGSWSGGVISFTKSEGTASTKEVRLCAASASWDGNTASVVMWDGTAADSSHGVRTGYTVTVNAKGRYDAGYSDGNSAGYSSGYNTGYNAGYNAGNSAGYSSGYNSGYSAGIGDVWQTYNSSNRYVDMVYGSSGTWTGKTGYYIGGMLDSSYNSGYSAGNSAGYSSGVTDGKNAVGLSSPYASDLPSGQLQLSRTFYVDTTGRGTNLRAEIPLHLYATAFSGGSRTVYLKWGAASGSSGTNYASLTLAMPTDVSIGSVNVSNTATKYTYDATKKVYKNYKYNWLPITIGGKKYTIRIEM